MPRIAHDALVTRLTAEGRGAIAVVRVWGPRALAVADAVFRPRRGRRLADTDAGVLRLGRVGRSMGDEVVALVRAGNPASVEIQCHGGNAAVETVIQALVEVGAERCDSIRSSDLAARDRLAEPALCDLAAAPTIRTAEILLDQVAGALHRETTRLIRMIEPEPALAVSGIDALLGREHVGRRLLSGWRVVIAGRPNVGKSRLFNALAGFTRAIVDAAAGTTRDVVTVRTSLSGWPVELVDTAGLRSTDDPIETLGIDRAWREQLTADLVLLVLDRSVPLDELDSQWLAAMRGALVVANKSDLGPAWNSLGGVASVAVSAERGDGIPNLIAAVVERLVKDPPKPGAAVPFRADQYEYLRAARERMLAGDQAGARRALEGLRDGVAPAGGIASAGTPETLGP